MVILVTRKKEKDPIKNEGPGVLIAFLRYQSMGILSDAQGQLISQSVMESNGTHLSFNGYPCYLQERRRSIKNEGARLLTTFFPLWGLCFFLFGSEAQDELNPQSVVESGRNCMVVLLTSKNEEDTINQRTNGPVNAHLISSPSKAQNIQNLEIYGKEMTLTFNTHIPSQNQSAVCSYQLSGYRVHSSRKIHCFLFFP